MHARVGRRELDELLTTSPARRAELGAFGEHDDLDDRVITRGHHRPDGAGLRALADRIGGILDVAAGVEAPAGRAHARADAEARVGRVRVLERAPRELEHRIDAHRSFTYGTPIARGATARPTKPARRHTVKTYGIAWMS